MIQVPADGAAEPEERLQARLDHARLRALRFHAEERIRAGGSLDDLRPLIRPALRTILERAESPIYQCRLLQMTSVTSSEDDTTAANANIAIHSMLMARFLALTETELLDVGAAALFHDLWREVSDVAMKTEAGALELLLRSPALSFSNQLTLLVALDLGRDIRKETAPEIEELPPVSQLVHIADAFERLQRGSPARAAMSPRAALELLQGGRSRYMPVLVDLLSDLIGQIPRGSLVKRSNGELALIVEGGARQSHKPLARRLQTADGRPDDELSLVRLDDPLDSLEDVAPESLPDLDLAAALLA